MIRRRPLLCFFVLAYALSWWPWVLGREFALFPFVATGPLLAALIVLAFTDGVAGLRGLGSRLIRWRVPWFWYAVAIVGPLMVGVGATLLGLAAGLHAPSLAGYTFSSALLVFAVRLIDPTDGPMGEEPGWRGYALPRLQATRSPLAATAILGVLVAGWHLPLVLVENEGSAVGLGAVALIGTFASTFFYCWIFNHTGGSVLLTLIAHSADGLITPGFLHYSGTDLVTWSTAYVGAWVLVALGIVAFDRQGWRAAPPAALE
ncbi:MAG: protease family protein [Thermoleophilaceae bacterium]|nr:protease family protein [Thermoleophilaceae bacterium]